MTDTETSIDLAGPWQLTSPGSDHQAEIQIPGDVHSALQAAGIIVDPYVGRNEEVVQWVAHRDWVLQRRFVLGEVDGDWYLDIDSLDTVATVTINDTVVLEADNCFRRYRPDVSKALRPGENTLSIVLHSSIAVGAALQEKQPFYIPYHPGNSPIANGNMLRKPQSHFGWDWNIAIAPLGLYGTVALRRLETARIESVTTRQMHNDDGTVDLLVTAALFAGRQGVAQLYFELTASGCGLIAAWWPARPPLPTSSISTNRGSGGLPAAASRRSTGCRSKPETRW